MRLYRFAFRRVAFLRRSDPLVSRSMRSKRRSQGPANLGKYLIFISMNFAVNAARFSASTNKPPITRTGWSFGRGGSPSFPRSPASSMKQIFNRAFPKKPWPPFGGHGRRCPRGKPTWVQQLKITRSRVNFDRQTCKPLIWLCRKLHLRRDSASCRPLPTRPFDWISLNRAMPKSILVEPSISVRVGNPDH